MKLIELMKIANEAYEDGLVLEFYYNEKTGEFVDNKDGGDSLARFIAIELWSTFNKKAKTGAQVAEATRVMTRARSQFDDIICALEAHR